MTEQLIMLHVLDKMKEAQQSFLGGTDKKAYVMKKVLEFVGGETYLRYEPLISLTIDLIKQIAVDKKILDGLYNSKCFMSDSMFPCVPKKGI